LLSFVGFGLATVLGFSLTVVASAFSALSIFF